MAATFPSVFAYQIIAAPFVAAFLSLGWVFWKVLDPGTSATAQNQLVTVVSFGIALASLCTMLGMSLAGFYEGWRIGWAFGKGRKFHDILAETPTLRLLVRLLQRTPLKRLARFASMYEKQ